MPSKPLSREDEVILRMLKTAPKPHADMKVRDQKKKPSRAKPATAKVRKPA